MSHAVTRKEHGAVAVVAALTFVVLISAGALAVDLGNAFVRKRDVQAQADFAALAGAEQLGNSNTRSVTDPAIIAVAQYLTKNQPQDDDGSGAFAVAPSQLVDGNDNNGEVLFTASDRMRVVAPPSLVKFGLAGAIGYSDIEVQADATVKIVSGGAVMPFYAVDGCDEGPQTITAPPPGPAESLNLAASGDNGNATLFSITPDKVDLNESPAPSLTISGSTFTGGAADASKVGFFRNDGTTIEPVDITPTSDSSITVPAIPPAVLSVSDVWYVRVYKNNKWSKMSEAQPLRVGNALLECLATPSDGNFGSLLLPRTDSNNSTADGWLPINIAEGLQEPLTLSVHDQALGPGFTCTGGVNGAVSSTTTGTPVPVAKTNCIDTDTGLTDNSATAGFIAGGSNGSTVFDGRLDADTTPGCGAQSDRDARWPTGITEGGGGHSEVSINDDVLTCFLDSGTSIGTIASEFYAGPAVLSQDIYRSPRFFLQPVLGVEPSTGGSTMYSIVDFRPAFLTDQPTTAMGGSTTLGTSTDHNGISVESGKISRVKVVFFDMDALPPPPDDVPTTDYIGAGPKLLRLTD